MKERLIYQHSYPPSPHVAPIDSIDEEEKEEVFDPRNITFGKLSTTSYVSIPCRETEGEEFIAKAINFSKMYRTDISIVQRNDRIRIYLSFDFSCEEYKTNQLFDMADRVSFFKDTGERDITVRLDLYTHVVLKNGLATAP